MQLEPKGIAWVGLHAKDLAHLADFYEHKLGLRAIEHDDACWIFDAGAGALFEMWGHGHASTQRKTAQEQSMVIGFLVERLEPVVASLAEGASLPTRRSAAISARDGSTSPTPKAIGSCSRTTMARRDPRPRGVDRGHRRGLGIGHRA